MVKISDIDLNSDDKNRTDRVIDDAWLQNLGLIGF